MCDSCWSIIACDGSKFRGCLYPESTLFTIFGVHALFGSL